MTVSNEIFKQPTGNFKAKNLRQSYELFGFIKIIESTFQRQTYPCLIPRHRFLLGPTHREAYQDFRSFLPDL